MDPYDSHRQLSAKCVRGPSSPTTNDVLTPELEIRLFGSTPTSSTYESTGVLVHQRGTALPAGVTDSEYLTCAGQDVDWSCAAGSHSEHRAFRVQLTAAKHCEPKSGERPQRRVTPSAHSAVGLCSRLGPLVPCLTRPWTVIVRRCRIVGADVSRETLTTGSYTKGESRGNIATGKMMRIYERSQCALYRAAKNERRANQQEPKSHNRPGEPRRPRRS